MEFSMKMKGLRPLQTSPRETEYFVDRLKRPKRRFSIMRYAIGGMVSRSRTLLYGLAADQPIFAHGQYHKPRDHEAVEDRRR